MVSGSALGQVQNQLFFINKPNACLGRASVEQQVYANLKGMCAIYTKKVPDSVRRVYMVYTYGVYTTGISHDVIALILLLLVLTSLGLSRTLVDPACLPT